MPSINCPIAECEYKTDDVDPALAAVLLTLHNNVHLSATVTPAATRNRAPKIERPKITAGSSEEMWSTFNTRWAMFKRSTGLAGAECVQQLFHCCDEELGNAILKGHPDVVSRDEDYLRSKIRLMAVTPVAISVRRAELLSVKQDHGEAARSFYAKVRGKAATCSYSIACSGHGCTQVNDFTDIMVKDVVISGLADEDVKKDVLGWSDLDNKTLDETITFIEAKEMARDAMSKGPIAAGLSTYKKSKAESAAKSPKSSCKSCKTEIDKFVWSRRQKRTVECTLCHPCWKKKQSKPVKGDQPVDEASALFIGAITEAEPILQVESSICSNITSHGGKEIILDHHIFHSQDGWKKAESLPHPTLRLKLATDDSDYNHINAPSPKVKQSDHSC